MADISLGVIGVSDGNGHPYSWSAIFNGYDPKVMESCPFPSIPIYLSKQKFPEDTIAGARVDYIWTQNANASKHIAAAAMIEHVVKDYRDMVGKVDAVLLARDDAETHLEIALPFLEAGLPIYIDKPLAYSVKEAREILDRQKFAGQVFSCSALRYAREFEKMKNIESKVAGIEYVQAIVMKSWNKYAVHIIDPVVTHLFEGAKVKDICVMRDKAVTSCMVLWNSGQITSFSSVGKAVNSIEIRLFGPEGNYTLIFEDTFYAFKAALQDFVCRCRNSDFREDTDLLKIISIVERGGQ